MYLGEQLHLEVDQLLEKEVQKALNSAKILRNQIKPIKSLAFAAEAFGKGQSISYKPTGSIEIRKAGAAFLEMRKRIELLEKDKQKSIDLAIQGIRIQMQEAALVFEKK